ncbi:MAG: methyltransferase type 11 [Chloroflexi bacterium RBG_16_63_12]|nr:MAG: methyltransferase type 11 [Chloroflexi bacterium RBG_16_63_12]
MNGFHRWLCQSGLWRRTLTRGLIPMALEGIDLGTELLEIGPGPGLSTDFLRQRVHSLTALEIDPALSASLRRRLAGTNVKVYEGDATQMPFEAGAFSAAVAFTMLHHMPSPALQDRLLAEVHGVLRPGGIFAGTDSKWSLQFQLIHWNDTMVVVDPATFGDRLRAAGFKDISIRENGRAFAFRARRP